MSHDVGWNNKIIVIVIDFKSKLLRYASVTVFKGLNNAFVFTCTFCQTEVQPSLIGSRTSKFKGGSS